MNVKERLCCVGHLLHKDDKQKPWKTLSHQPLAVCARDCSELMYLKMDIPELCML